MFLKPLETGASVGRPTLSCLGRAQPTMCMRGNVATVAMGIGDRTERPGSCRQGPRVSLWPDHVCFGAVGSPGDPLQKVGICVAGDARRCRVPATAPFRSGPRSSFGRERNSETGGDFYLICLRKTDRRSTGRRSSLGCRRARLSHHGPGPSNRYSVDAASLRDRVSSIDEPIRRTA